MKRLAIPAMVRPASTRSVDDATVMSTASNGVGPELGSTPISHRFAVLKFLACPAKSPRKMCGGGKRRLSATPIYQRNSHKPANKAMEMMLQPTFGPYCRMKATMGWKSVEAGGAR